MIGKLKVMKSFFFRVLLLSLLTVCNVDLSYASNSGSAPAPAPVQRSSSSVSPDAVTLSPEKVICNIVLALSGPISQGIATLVIIITGYSFFVGKVSIGMLFIVSGGIILVFGSQTIFGWALGTRYVCVESTAAAAPAG